MSGRPLCAQSGEILSRSSGRQAFRPRSRWRPGLTPSRPDARQPGHPARREWPPRSGPHGFAALEFGDQLQAFIERDVAVEHAREEGAEGQRHLVVDAVGARISMVP